MNLSGKNDFQPHSNRKLGSANDYSHIKNWEFKDTGYQTGEMVIYKNNVFIADYWAQAAPGEKPKPQEGWRLYDVIYDNIQSSIPRSETKVIGYVPTWRTLDQFAYDDFSTYKSVTHVIVSFLMFSATSLGHFDQSSVKAVDNVIPVIQRALGEEERIHLMVSVGGGTDYGFKFLLREIGRNENHPLLESSAKLIADYVNRNDLAGVDLDLECWWDPNGDDQKDEGGRNRKDGPHPAGSGLLLLAKKLKEMMPGKLVTAAVPGTSWYGNNFDPEMHKYLDWIGLMTYDFTGSWKNSPVGPHSQLYAIKDQKIFETEQHGEWPGGGPVNNPIFSLEEAFWYWSNPFYSNWQGEGARVPAEKLVFGVAAYGYDFAYGNDADPVTGIVPKNYKTIAYKDILKFSPNLVDTLFGNIKVEGRTKHPSFLNKDGEYPYKHNIYYDSPFLARNKMKFCHRVGCQGAMVWEVSQDSANPDLSILDELFKESGATRPKIIVFGKNRLRDWMKSVSDRKLISDLVIPGTHDSGTATVRDIFAKPVAQTVEWTISEQLNNGIRFLDIRVVLCADDEALCIFHGVAYCNLNFDDVLNSMIHFLNSNPHEVLFMRLKNEREKDDKQRVAHVILKYLNKHSQYFWEKNSAVNKSFPLFLGQIRGKIILLGNYDHYDEKYGINYNKIHKEGQYEFKNLREAFDKLGLHLINSRKFERNENHFMCENVVSGLFPHIEAFLVFPTPKYFQERFEPFYEIIIKRFQVCFEQSPARKLQNRLLRIPPTLNKSISILKMEEILQIPYYRDKIEKIFDHCTIRALSKPKGIISMDFPKKEIIEIMIEFNRG